MHRPPHRYTALLVRLGLAKVVCSYRDPRDIVLSALDHGRRNREDPSGSTIFTKFTDVESTLYDVSMWLKVHEEWRDFAKDVLLVRYEDFMADKYRIAEQINHFLELKVPGSKLDSILEEYDKRKTRMRNFNKGTTNRYLQDMDSKDIEKCEHAFRKYLAENNYALPEGVRDKQK
jgi:hypothetical protein